MGKNNYHAVNILTTQNCPQLKGGQVVAIRAGGIGSAGLFSRLSQSKKPYQF